jgi:hypothetical protein
MVKLLKDKKKFITVFSLYTEAINTKYDVLKSLFEEELEIENVRFTVICLQETWLREQMHPKTFSLKHSTLMSQTSSPTCKVKGHLSTYVFTATLRNNWQVGIFSGNISDHQATFVALDYKIDKQLPKYVNMTSRTREAEI